MELSKHKFVIISGCSYDRFAVSLREPFLDCYSHGYSNSEELRKVLIGQNPELQGLDNFIEYADENTIIISLGVGGFGNFWVTESVQYFINFLKENNVPNSNIYVLASFTNMLRYGVEMPSDDFKYSIPDLIPRSTIFGSAFGKSHSSIDISYKLNTSNKFGRLNYYTGIGRLGEKYIAYSTLTRTNQDTFSKEDKEYKYIRAMKEFFYGPSKNYMYDNKRVIATQLDYIISLGEYLENEKIKYNFCSMYSLFGNLYEVETAPFTTLGLNTIYTDNLTDKFWYKNENGLNKSESLIEDRFPEYREVVQKILSYNWVMYKKENITRGGIDEFTMKEFGDAGYASTNRMILDHSIPKPQNHPHSVLYPLIFKYFAKDCDFINIKDSYVDSVDKFINKFFYKTGFELDKPLEYPLLTKELFKDELPKWIELKTIHKRKWN